MKKKSPKQKLPRRQSDASDRIARLIGTIRESEEELQALTGGQLDAVISEGSSPYLLRDAQEQLRLSEAAQRVQAEIQMGILNALPAHIALLNSHGVIVAVNEAWRRFASANVLQSADFYVGQNYLGVCEGATGECADEASAVAAGIRQVLDGQVEAFALEYPCHSPTERRWFRLMVTPVTATPGSGAVVMHVNVTERRLAEEILREQEREQRRLAEQLTLETSRLHESQAVANVGSWETDLATLEVIWTKETYRIFETSREEFKSTHQDFLLRVHPEDRQRVDDAFKSSYGQPTPSTIEHRLLLPDGRIKFVEERWQSFNDATGTPVRAVGTCQDITQRKMAEDLIRIRARQQETIAKIGFEATRATTLEGIFDFATRALVEALDVELCKVLQLAPDGSCLRLVSGVGWQAGLIGVCTVGVDRESQAGFTLQSDGPIYVNDLAKETRFISSPLLRQHDVVSGLSVNILLRDKPWGVLSAHCRTVRSFNGADADFMQTVASLLAVVIERLAVQHTLTESEARMRDAQRIAHLGNWELDIAKNELTWSEEVFRIFGVEPAGFSSTYEAFFALVHPDDREAMRAAQSIALSGRGPLEIEHRIIRGDGEIRFIRERGELIHDGDGAPVALSGTVLDITALRAAQSRAERVNDLLTEAQRIADMGSWEMDLATGRLVWSEETCRLFGIQSGEFGGTFEAFTEFILPEDRPAYSAVHATITPAAPLLESEYRIRRPDGTVRWMFERGMVTFDSTGMMTRRLGVVMDITGRRKNEEQLRLLETCVSRLNDIVLITEAEPIDDPGPRILYVNDAFVRRTGFSREEAIGKTPRLLQGPKTQRDALDRIRAALKAWKPVREELINYTKSGEEFWLELDIVPVADATGWFTHWVAIERDITERKQAEEQLRQREQLLGIAGKVARLGGWSVDFPEVRITWSDEVCVIHDMPLGTVPALDQALGFYTPESRPVIESAFSLCASEGTPFDVELEVLTAKGRRAWVRSIGQAERDKAGAIRRVQGAFQDITEQKKAESEALRAAEALAGIVQVQQEIAKEDLPLAEVMQLMAERAMVLTGATGGVVEYAEGAEMVYTAVAGVVADKIGFRLRHEGSLSGLVFSTGTVLKCEDTETDPRVDLPSCREVGARSMIVTPLRVGDEIIGVLKVLSGEPRAFSTRDVQNLQILVETLGVVIHRRRAAEALRESVEEFRTLAEAMPQIVWVTRADGWTIYFNQYWMDYTGMTLEESLGHGWNKPFHPDDQHRAWEAWQRATSTVGEYSLECRLRRADGEYRWWLIRGEPHRDADGTVIKWFGTCTDIHDLKEADFEITRINRALKMLSACNEALIHAVEESALLEEICQIAVLSGGYRMAWVGYAQEDARRTIQPLAHAGEEAGYLSDAAISWEENAPNGSGPAGRTIRTGQPHRSEDIEQDASFHWRDVARQRGYRSVICLPLRSGTRTFGLLGLYSAEVLQAGAEELKLLQELADDLAFGIGHLRAQRQSERIHSAVTRVASAVSASTGTEFFEQLAENMAGALGAAAGFVAEMLPGEPPAARTIAAMVDGKKIDNFDYAIAGTPCLHLLADDECVVSDRVAELFPNASTLASLGAEAYVGRRLTNAAGEKIGLIFVLFREPLKETAFITSTLRIFAARAASELERQKSDKQLREQAALLNAAHDAILVRDIYGHVRYWNKGAERLYGWAADEVVGRQASDFLYRDLTEVEGALQEVLTKDRWEGELHKVGKDGRTILVQASWTLLRDSDGRPTSVLAINSDLTEKKKLEAQFLRAQRMESIGTMAGGIAHDLNNVLAPILMSVDMLKLTAQSQEDQELLVILESSAQRGANLVSQVLSFARGVEGQRVPVNVGHLIRELVRVTRETFPKNITIESKYSANLWSVIGDPTQIHQVILNLGVNARDAMPTGGTLTIGADNIVLDDTYASMNLNASPGSYVVIKVEDSGTGIPPELVERVFEPFFTTKETGKGTGLGLSTTAAIVKSHGGFINLYSEVGKGTKFRIYFPADASQKASEEQSIEQTRLPRGKGELILVVDDEVNIRSVAKSTLERFGYSVMVASHGAEAIAIYAQHQSAIAVILTDMAMPIMDGPTMIIALKTINPHVRIIGSSGLSSNGGAAKAVGADVEHFIPKPYTAESMLRSIRACLDSQ